MDTAVFYATLSLSGHISSTAYEVIGAPGTIRRETPGLTWRQRTIGSESAAAAGQQRLPARRISPIGAGRSVGSLLSPQRIANVGEFNLGQIFSTDDRIARRPCDPDQLIELKLNRRRVARLTVLNQEDHKKCDYGRAGIHH